MLLKTHARNLKALFIAFKSARNGYELSLRGLIAWPSSYPALQRRDFNSVAHLSVKDILPVARGHGQQGLSLFVEALTISSSEQFPVAHDAILAGSEDFGGRQLVALLAVGGLRGWQQVPDIIVVPKVKRDDMVDIEALPQRGAGPDAFQPIQL